MALDEVQTVVSPMIGQRCWCARRGHGSFLTLELGRAVPEVYAAIPADRLEGLPARLRERARAPWRVWHGEWHLWLYLCAWAVERRTPRAAGPRARDPYAAAARPLIGEVLRAVDVDPRRGATTFTFEHAWLHVTPTDAAVEELWKLAMPDGRWLSVRSSGEYSIRAGDDPRDPTWRLLERPA